MKEEIKYEIVIPPLIEERWEKERKKVLAKSRVWTRSNRWCSSLGIYGFIVNIHDAVNYDIDFGSSGLSIPEYAKNDVDYRAIINKYRYLILGRTLEEREGFACRCRLRGVKMKRELKSPSNKEEKKKFFIEVNKLIDREDGWVRCTIHGMDVYGRLLIDVFVGGLSMKKILLNKAEKEKSDVFQKYERRHDQ